MTTHPAIRLALLAALLIPPFVMAVSAPAKAQPAPASCMDTATTQRDLTQCAGALASAADARLNRSYHAVMCHLAPDEAALLAASQRAWLKFRDMDCAFWGDGDGSIAPMNGALCVERLSLARAKELDGWPPNASRKELAKQCE